MKCSICSINEASVHLTEVINDKVTKLHICEECAKKKSEEMQSHFGLTDLLSSLMDFGPAISEKETAEDAKNKCSLCGMSYYDFQRTGKLGCGKCYETFEKNLGELLVKIHGATKHVGKIPLRGKEEIKTHEDLQSLKNELNELIGQEEFEKAAALRDKIRELEKRLLKS